MKIEMTSEQVMAYMEREHCSIFFEKKQGKAWCEGVTNFQIRRNSESVHYAKLDQQVNAKIGNLPCVIFSDNELSGKEVQRITKEPFKFIDEFKPDLAVPVIPVFGGHLVNCGGI